jgi:hypothetical protein
MNSKIPYEELDGSDMRKMNLPEKGTSLKF